MKTTKTKSAHGAVGLVKECGMVQLASTVMVQALSLLRKMMTTMNKKSWPFPPATGAVPWTAKQVKEYAQQQRQQTEDAPL
jgi:hypothetical protein